MKLFLCLISFWILLSFNISSQMHQVSGGNIGLVAFGGMSTNKSSLENYKTNGGYFFGVGATTSIKNFLFPEIHYSLSDVNYGTNDSLNLNYQNKNQSLGFSLNSKLHFYSLRLGKSTKGECWWLNLKLLAGYNYALHFSNKSNFQSFANQNDSRLEFGLGINPKYSGGHKSRVAWSYFYDIVYRLDLNKNNNFKLQDASGWQQNGIFFRVTILHHKTSDFLGGNQKKKSYGKKY